MLMSDEGLPGGKKYAPRSTLRPFADQRQIDRITERLEKKSQLNARRRKQHEHEHGHLHLHQRVRDAMTHTSDRVVQHKVALFIRGVFLWHPIRRQHLMQDSSQRMYNREVNTVFEGAVVADTILKSHNLDPPSSNTASFMDPFSNELLDPATVTRELMGSPAGGERSTRLERCKLLSAHQLEVYAQLYEAVLELAHADTHHHVTNADDENRRGAPPPKTNLLMHKSDFEVYIRCHISERMADKRRAARLLGGWRRFRIAKRHDGCYYDLKASNSDRYRLKQQEGSGWLYEETFFSANGPLHHGQKNVFAEESEGKIIRSKVHSLQVRRLSLALVENAVAHAFHLRRAHDFENVYDGDKMADVHYTVDEEIEACTAGLVAQAWPVLTKSLGLPPTAQFLDKLLFIEFLALECEGTTKKMRLLMEAIQPDFFIDSYDWLEPFLRKLESEEAPLDDQITSSCFSDHDTLALPASYYSQPPPKNKSFLNFCGF